MKHTSIFTATIASLLFFLSSCSLSTDDVAKQVKTAITEKWEELEEYDDMKLESVTLTQESEKSYKGTLSIKVEGETVETPIKVKIKGEQFEWEMELIAHQVEIATIATIEEEFIIQGLEDYKITDLILIKRVGNEYTGQIEFEYNGERASTSIEVVMDHSGIAYEIDTESLPFEDEAEGEFTSIPAEDLDLLTKTVAEDIINAQAENGITLTLNSFALTQQTNTIFVGDISLTDSNNGDIYENQIGVEYDGEEYAYEIIE